MISNIQYYMIYMYEKFDYGYRYALATFGYDEQTNPKDIMEKFGYTSLTSALNH